MLVLILADHFDNHLNKKCINNFPIEFKEKHYWPIQLMTPLSFAFSCEKFIWLMGEPCDTSTSISSGVKWTPERKSASDNSGYWNR